MGEERIGMIGVGLMGHGIARNILAKGWRLAYLRHPGNQPTADLDASGATGMENAAGLARASDILLLCVTGSPQVEDVMTGSGQVLAALRPGTVVVDCSTAIPEATVAMAAKLAAAGCQLVDAAMTRTPKEAAEGRLNLLVGGETAVVARIMPLLEAFSENRFHAGPTGAGHRLKLLHNFVSLGMVTLLAEAAACAGRAGIAPEVLVDCLRRGGGHGAALDRIAPYLLEGQTDQLRFTIDNSLKDLGYYKEMTGELGAAARLATATKQTLSDASASGHGDAFLPELAGLLRDQGD